jgi:hypothetical protein
MALLYAAHITQSHLCNFGAPFFFFNSDDRREPAEHCSGDAEPQGAWGEHVDRVVPRSRGLRQHGGSQPDRASHRNGRGYPALPGGWSAGSDRDSVQQAPSAHFQSVSGVAQYLPFHVHTLDLLRIRPT